MIPPYFAPSPDRREVRAVISALHAALREALPKRVAYLSSIGAQQTSGIGLITALHMLEESMDTLPVPTAALRAGWFMENSVWDVAPAREQGKLYSFLQPLDHSFALVATEDIGQAAAQTLLEGWTGHRRIEVAGPRRYSPQDIAATFLPRWASPSKAWWCRAKRGQQCSSLKALRRTAQRHASKCWMPSIPAGSILACRAQRNLPGPRSSRR